MGGDSPIQIADVAWERGATVPMRLIRRSEPLPVIQQFDPMERANMVVPTTSTIVPRKSPIAMRPCRETQRRRLASAEPTPRTASAKVARRMGTSSCACSHTSGLLSWVMADRISGGLAQLACLGATSFLHRGSSSGACLRQSTKLPRVRLACQSQRLEEPGKRVKSSFPSRMPKSLRFFGKLLKKAQGFADWSRQSFSLGWKSLQTALPTPR